MALNSIEELVEDIRQGKMVILMDDEDRENEGDIIMAAEACKPEHINFMAKHARGLICMPMSRERCELLKLPLMAPRNGSGFGTKFTVSIEATTGVTTGISAADRARTVQAAAAKDAKAEDIVSPGHIFPLMAQPGGTLARAGHTEAACDLARMAGFEPSGVICEVMNDDGTMARRTELEAFAAEHSLKIGTIADLIQYRSSHESLVQKVSSRELQTAYGTFTAHAFHESTSNSVHLALVQGAWSADDSVPVRVHEPLSVLDALEVERANHSWSLHAALAHIQQAGRGVAVLLNCGEDAAQLLAQFEGTARAAHAPERGRMDLRSYGVGAQILRDLGVQRMQVMGAPRRLPSMAGGYGLEIVEYVDHNDQGNTANARG